MSEKRNQKNQDLTQEDNQKLIKTKNSNIGEKSGIEDDSTTPAADVVNELEFNCFEIAQEYINALDDPDEIKQNNGLFVDMLKEIYRQYLGVVIGNINNTYIHYDYMLMDKIFYIYTKLVYRYKQNKRPSIIEYSLFTNMDRMTIHNAAYGLTKKLTPKEVSTVKKWYSECENQLTNGSSVFEIFLLKSQYRYNDNLSPIPIESQGSVMAVNELPDLSIAKIANNDSDVGSQRRNQESKKGKTP